MINLLLRLFAAHLVADFFLQFDCVNEGKYKNGRKGVMWLLLHGLTHGIIVYLFLAQWDNWFIPLFVFLSHTLVDWLKVVYSRKVFDERSKLYNREVIAFVIDQVVHVFFLVLSVYLYWLLWNRLPIGEGCYFILYNSRFWAVAVAYMAVLKPSGLLISMLTKRWRCSVQQDSATESDGGSLAKAGAWIGYCERVMALTFILMNCVQGVGFLLAAKSIFRFGNLKDGRETKMTEYVLLGTLLSMSIAVSVGFLLTGFLFNWC